MTYQNKLDKQLTASVLYLAETKPINDVRDNLDMTLNSFLAFKKETK